MIERVANRHGLELTIGATERVPVRRPSLPALRAPPRATARGACALRV